MIINFVKNNIELDAIKHAYGIFYVLANLGYKVLVIDFESQAIMTDLCLSDVTLPNKTHDVLTGIKSIDDCIEKYNLPVAANNKGYFIIANENEYDEYMANLDSRKAGIDERKSIITKFFKGEK